MKFNAQAEMGKNLRGTGIPSQIPGLYIYSQTMAKSDKEASHEL
jgi:hypothetical protein